MFTCRTPLFKIYVNLAQQSRYMLYCVGFIVKLMSKIIFGYFWWYKCQNFHVVPEIKIKYVPMVLVSANASSYNFLLNGTTHYDCHVHQLADLNCSGILSRSCSRLFIRNRKHPVPINISGSFRPLLFPKKNCCGKLVLVQVWMIWILETPFLENISSPVYIILAKNAGWCAIFVSNHVQKFVLWGESAGDRASTKCIWYG